ncbi:hypothetical protein A0O36_00765 [Piscirickettsiaceae bacterium NZ-RLO1]|nr:hypothetical protein A0O36_00765 [Piscirickettsiaceae bacterium NZ-RLO1]
MPSLETNIDTRIKQATINDEYLMPMYINLNRMYMTDLNS